jgi:hypothetical protein
VTHWQFALAYDVHQQTKLKPLLASLSLKHPKMELTDASAPALEPELSAAARRDVGRGEARAGQALEGAGARRAPRPYPGRSSCRRASAPSNATLNSASVLKLVRETGVEPARLAALEPKSSASANSATRAFGRPHLDGGEAAVLAPRAENVSAFAEASVREAAGADGVGRIEGAPDGMVCAVGVSGHPAPVCAVLDGGWGFV